jgi:hypothetical protein
MQAGEFVDLTYTADINTFATACTFVFDSLEALDFEELDNCQTVNDFSQPATCRWPGSNTGGLFLFGMLCNSDPTTVVFQIEVSVLAPQLVLFADVDTASTGEQILITASATGSVTDLNGTFISQPLVGRSVTFKIVEGSGTLTESASTNRTAAAVTRRATQLTVPTDEAGSAIVSAVADEPGWLLIEAFVETGSINTFPKEGNSLGPITITGDPLTPLVASVSLTPTLSEAHLGEPVSLTATALDIGGNPFPGAKVCLLSAGRAQLEYYYPHSQPQRPVKSLCGVADTQGKVTLSFTSKIPGTVGVVAAALHSGRGSVVSAPSHVMFWGQEHP